MHQEQNIAESIMSMCFDVTGFMKDNMNIREDLAALCDRPLLEAKRNAKGKLSRRRAILKSICEKYLLNSVTSIGRFVLSKSQR
jgi:hypothetical protein